jgi:hypothetical protein
MSIAAKQPVFVCRLDALTAPQLEEQKELRARLERAITGVTEDTEGYTFSYAEEITAATIITWVENERKCCPFLRFTLDMPEDGGPSRLRVWGVPGVKAFVAAEMNVKTS